jgi:hypothetical protein
VVSYCDVAGSAALVGAVEGAGDLCSSGEIAGTHAYDEEVYFRRGTCEYSEGKVRIFERLFYN